jgi:CHAD domain-containing protein
MGLNRESQKAPQIAWNEKSSAALNARRRLPELIPWYFAGGRALLAGNPPVADFHRLRLATKRVRYTLELFRPCYGPALERRIDELKGVQQLLGELNDIVAFQRMLAERNEPGSRQARLEGFLVSRLDDKVKEFREYWSGTFDAPGRELRWTKYLGRSARAPRKTT